MWHIKALVICRPQEVTHEKPVGGYDKHMGKEGAENAEDMAANLDQAVEPVQVPRGTFDILPQEMMARQAIETSARAIFTRAGYARMETPSFEATELFARGVGGSTDIVQKEMFTFHDAAGRSFALRPEGTASVCRSYIEQGMHKLPQPVKRWYLGSFYRHETPQAGRFRQFTQIGAEALGSDDPAVDAELMLLLAELLETSGVQSILRIGSLGSSQTRAVYREELQAYLTEHQERLSPEVAARIQANPLRAFDSGDRSTQEVMAGAPLLLDRLNQEDREHYETVKELLDAAHIPYTEDATLVRGLDYYSRTVFEFVNHQLGAQSGVAGGGRYDGLMEKLGGPATPAAGFAAGVERILLAGDDAPSVAPCLDLYIAWRDDKRTQAFCLVQQARRAGLRVEMEMAGRGLKGQFKQADRLGARYTYLLGESAGALKNMQSGEQTEGLDNASVIERLCENPPG